eukprot:TRINITY_DN1962_c0_g1_i5.p1 TRINITY_DN1962_c0_g1~~TRINITY_DN1962_c0_g1_i5.p1  ORF type:complete len:223 (+),score=26.73 TRINITY_DN1962_c0_g1_i5:501-1169(+)
MFSNTLVPVVPYQYSTPTDGTCSFSSDNLMLFAHGLDTFASSEIALQNDPPIGIPPSSIHQPTQPSQPTQPTQLEIPKNTLKIFVEDSAPGSTMYVKPHVSNAQVVKEEFETTQKQSTPPYSGELVPSLEHSFMDITPYMTLPQAEAAKRLGIPPSTLSKRWRSAAQKRKWPWRLVAKIDKEIATLMYNINPSEPLEKDQQERLSRLLLQREKELSPVKIRV